MTRRRGFDLVDESDPPPAVDATPPDPPAPAPHVHPAGGVPLATAGDVLVVLQAWIDQRGDSAPTSLPDALDDLAAAVAAVRAVIR